MGKYQAAKDLCREYFAKMENCSPEDAAKVLAEYAAPDFTWEGVYPFMDIAGVEKTAEVFWTPLKQTLKHMQRRQDVFMAGTSIEDNKTWVMSMGQFMGLFDQDYLGIRRTRKMQHLQYAEFICVENGKFSHIAMFVDLIGMMKGAGQYPLMAETGNYFVYPGPRDHNGLLFKDAEDEAAAEALAKANHELVMQMGADLGALVDADAPEGTLNNTKHFHPRESLTRTWAEDMIWYGPCGVGAAYTIDRYQEQHQGPFRDFLTDIRSKTQYPRGYFAEGDFVCLFGSLEIIHQGSWLGMPGNNQSLNLRGDIDIYYCKDGKISENWCLFDIPYWLKQQGVDIFKRTELIANYTDDLK